MDKTNTIIWLHRLINFGLVVTVTVFIHLELLPLALTAVAISKWRIFSIKPHRLRRNLRANACDLIVIISTVLLIDLYIGSFMSLILAVFLAIWLIVIKPWSGFSAIVLQAGLCQAVGLSALWFYGVEKMSLSSYATIVIASAIGYYTARHALQPAAIDAGLERKVISVVWAIVVAELAWLSWLWSISYRITADISVPQIVLTTFLLGYLALETIKKYRDGSKTMRRNLSLRQAGTFLLFTIAIMLLTPWIGI